MAQARRGGLKAQAAMAQQAVCRTPSLILHLIEYEPGCFLLFDGEDRCRYAADALGRSGVVLRYLREASAEQRRAAVLQNFEALMVMPVDTARPLYCELVRPILEAYGRGDAAAHRHYRQVAAAAVFRLSREPPLGRICADRDFAKVGKLCFAEAVAACDGPVVRALLKNMGFLVQFAGRYRSDAGAVAAAFESPNASSGQGIMRHVGAALRRDRTVVKRAIEADASGRSKAFKYAKLSLEDEVWLAPSLRCNMLAMASPAARKDARFVLDVLTATRECNCSRSTAAKLDASLATDSAVLAACMQCFHPPGDAFMQDVPEIAWAHQETWQTAFQGQLHLPPSFWRFTLGLSNSTLQTWVLSIVSVRHTYANIGPLLLMMHERDMREIRRCKQATVEYVIDSETLIFQVEIFMWCYSRCPLIKMALNLVDCCIRRTKASAVRSRSPALDVTDTIGWISGISEAVPPAGSKNFFQLERDLMDYEQAVVREIGAWFGLRDQSNTAISLLWMALGIIDRRMGASAMRSFRDLLKIVGR